MFLAFNNTWTRYQVSVYRTIGPVVMVYIIHGTV